MYNKFKLIRQMLYIQENRFLIFYIKRRQSTELKKLQMYKKWTDTFYLADQINYIASSLMLGSAW
jgi:hypothetical protein